ncbi:hypothetical protein BRO54_2529 [Geobacillus proteiniphilus]|uniref:Uncharacterized protein n=1 Tax=Geobacillus proteiniphilus TaxID=860353 RepID=A0A1Q5SV91_9BACL|nr:hypothetical protein BRO54_2529 [Geobacillus proteiniphilus]
MIRARKPDYLYLLLFFVALKAESLKTANTFSAASSCIFFGFGFHSHEQQKSCSPKRLRLREQLC